LIRSGRKRIRTAGPTYLNPTNAGERDEKKAVELVADRSANVAAESVVGTGLTAGGEWIRKFSSAISDVKGTESFADSPLEQAGFELPVPLATVSRKNQNYLTMRFLMQTKMGKIAASSKAKPVATTPENIGFIAVKFALHDGSFETVLLDYFSARVSGQ
jgi:hypothetical protein